MLYFLPSPHPSATPDRFGLMLNACAVYRALSRSYRAALDNGFVWSVDNGAYSGKFTPGTFFGFLERWQAYAPTCRFAVVPDVVADAVGTLARWDEFAPRVRALGYPTAYVAQNGAESLPFPDSFDVLFIGGSTGWKMGPGAIECIRRARGLGKWVHVGRVNSGKRFRHFQTTGANSCDGTHFVYKPDVYIHEISKWTRQQVLFTV